MTPGLKITQSAMPPVQHTHLALAGLRFSSGLGLGFGKCCQSVAIKGLSVIRALGHCSEIF